MIYAGFWKRAVAFFIDGIILSIPSVLFSFATVGSQLFSAASAVNGAAPSPAVPSALGKWMLGMMAMWALNIILLWLYHAIMESGKHQATVGKIVMGIKVVGLNGERISFARATGRTFAKFISHMPLYFGDYMAGFTKHRQALHDLIAATYVVNKNYQEGQELPAVPFSVGGLIASIVAAFSPILLYVGIMAAFMMWMVPTMKNDPDMQKIWNDPQIQNALSQDSDFPKWRNDIERDVYLSTAQLELFQLSRSNAVLEKPVEKEGITYSQSGEGYKASFKDPNGNEYELLQRPDEVSVCCLKGPGGKCTDDNILYQPCK